MNRLRHHKFAIVWLVLLSPCIQSAIADASSPVSSLSPGTSPSVVSMNLCADQLVLALADTGQIASLSNLSHERAGSYYYEEALKYPVNTGQAGEIALIEPDVVIAGSFSNRYSTRAMKSIGLRVETLPIANSIESMLSNIEQVGRWIGQADRAADLIESLRKQLDTFDQQNQVAQSRIAVYDPNGYTVGENTLRGEVLKRAGWHNVADDAGIDSYGVLSLETMLRLRPDVLMESPYSPGTYSRAQKMTDHPALRLSKLSPSIISVPSAQTICGGPWTVDLIARLIDERIKIESQRLQE